MNSSAFSSSIITLITISGLASGSTIAVSYLANKTACTVVCGIISSKLTQSIQCYKDGLTVSIQPNTSYESISGGLGYFCGLQSGGYSIICWDTVRFQAKRIYYSKDNRLKELSVGNYNVCALQLVNGLALCWRFPAPGQGLVFRSITSGAGFSCGVLKNNSRVHCWGNNSETGVEIERQFGNLKMVSLTAGESHACGLTGNGALICKGSNNSGQLDVPSHFAFEFSGLALGSNHSCAIRRKNGLLVCWGGGSRKSQFLSNLVKQVSFEQIVAGLDFTCGLTTKNLSIICWGPGWSRELVAGNVVPLKPVIPGPCVEISCTICGVYPNSGNLCAGSGIICRSCEVELPIPVILPSTPASSESPRLVSSPSRTLYKLFLAFSIVGFVGTFVGFCTIVYCIWTGFCGKLQNKVYKPVARPAVNARSNLENYLSASNAAILAASTSSSIKRDDSWALWRHRSGSSSRRTERTENFTLSELAAITNNFASENKIGGGSFGRVYKAGLPDGRVVAIKRGESSISTATKKFQEKESAYVSELALLSCLNHKNLVGLVGCCQENDERLLIYEYMRNGSLHDHLHSERNAGSSILNSWKLRIRIALDAAMGIEYLHNYSIPPIIHRDIKSSNILLDEKWTAKVSDFGLSLMWPESEFEPMFTKAVGTIGYIDPEYYVLNILTVKSDVYGFGVVLLELLTGKKAVFKNEGTGPMGVVEYARPWILSGEVESILDKRVGTPKKNEIEAVEFLAYTALHSTNLQGKDRPTMSEVVAELEKAFSLCQDTPEWN